MEFEADDLARVFYTLRANQFGQNSCQLQAVLDKYFKTGNFRICFESLSKSFITWAEEGMPVDPGVYFKALFGVFGAETYPSHIVAECGLSIYIQSLAHSTKSEPRLSSSHVESFREERVNQLVESFGMSREEVLEHVDYLLPD